MTKAETRAESVRNLNRAIQRLTPHRLGDADLWNELDGHLWCLAQRVRAARDLTIDDCQEMVAHLMGRLSTDRNFRNLVRRASCGSRYLHRVMQHYAIKQRKGKKRERKAYRSWGELDHRENAIQDPLRQLLKAEELNRVRDAALNRLPSHYSTVLNLFYFEDLAIRKIARRLKVTPSVVSSRLVRARLALREFLLNERR